MGLGGVVVLGEWGSKARGWWCQWTWLYNQSTKYQQDECMRVCDGIKLSVSRTFDPVVFLWLWTDTLYSSMFTSMQLVGLPSTQHQHPKIASDGIPNGKWRDVRWIIQQSTGVLVDIIGCWEGIWHRYPKYFHFVYSSYGKYTTQHSHHDSGDNMQIHLWKQGIYNTYRSGVPSSDFYRWMLLLRMTHIGNEWVSIQCDTWERTTINYKQSRTVYDTYTTINHRCALCQQQGMFYQEVGNTTINGAVVSTKINWVYLH